MSWTDLFRGAGLASLLTFALGTVCAERGWAQYDTLPGYRSNYPGDVYGRPDPGLNYRGRFYNDNRYDDDWYYDYYDRNPVTGYGINNAYDYGTRSGYGYGGYDNDLDYDYGYRGGMYGDIEVGAGVPNYDAYDDDLSPFSPATNRYDEYYDVLDDRTELYEPLDYNLLY